MMLLLAALLALAPSPEELELVARSLRPEGRAELERNAGPIAAQPLYEVEAELDATKARLEGRLRLLYRNREAAPLGELVLRLWPEVHRGGSLSCSEVQLDGKPARAHVSGSVMEISLSRALQPGETAQLSLRFRGRLKRMKKGDDSLSASLMPMLGALGQGGMPGRMPPTDGYGTFAVGPHGAVLVDWYPQLAVRAGGKWDRREPGANGDVGRAEPASAVVSLTVPRGWRIAGAGAALGQRALADGRQHAAFAMAGVRGPLGMAAAPSFSEAIDDAGPVHLRASSLRGEGDAQRLLRCGKQALRVLEQRFGAYPWQDLALAEAPLTGGAGGIEQPGLALVARALGGAGVGSLLQPPLFDFTCWHEVAHQWWQGVVGSDPRSAPWVDEALAQYSAALVAEGSAEGGPSLRAGRDALARHAAVNFQLMRMLGVPDGPVARDADSFASPLQYAGLVYGKAPHFFQRARETMGDEAFFAAARAYRAAWAFREAGPRAFLDAARAASPQAADTLAALDRHWLREAHGDDDLGPLDPFALLGSDLGGLSDVVKKLSPGAPGGQLQMPDDKELQQMMQSMQKLMPQLQEMLDSMGGGLAPQDSPDDDQ